MMNELPQGRQRGPRGNWGSRYSSWTSVTLPALSVLTLASASSDSIQFFLGNHLSLTWIHRVWVKLIPLLN